MSEPTKTMAIPQAIANKAHKSVEGYQIDFEELELDPELRSWLDRPDEGKFMVLVNSIIKEGGVKDPLVVWHRKGKQVVVDGYTRIDALQYIKKTTGSKQFAYVAVTRKDFASNNEAKLWMISRQQAERRNLTPWQQAYYIGFAYAQAVIHDPAERNKEGVEQTNKKIAEQYGVSERTVHHDYKFFLGIDHLMKVNTTLGSTLKSDGAGLNRRDVELLSGVAVSKLSAVKTITDVKELITGLKQKKKKGPPQPKMQKAILQLSDKFIKKPTPENYDALYTSTLSWLESLKERLKGANE